MLRGIRTLRAGSAGHVRGSRYRVAAVRGHGTACGDRPRDGSGSSRAVSRLRTLRAGLSTFSPMPGARWRWRSKTIWRRRSTRRGRHARRRGRAAEACDSSHLGLHFLRPVRSRLPYRGAHRSRRWGARWLAGRRVRSSLATPGSLPPFAEGDHPGAVRAACRQRAGCWLIDREGRILRIGGVAHLRDGLARALAERVPRAVYFEVELGSSHSARERAARPTHPAPRPSSRRQRLGRRSVRRRPRRRRPAAATTPVGRRGMSDGAAKGTSVVGVLSDTLGTSTRRSSGARGRRPHRPRGRRRLRPRLGRVAAHRAGHSRRGNCDSGAWALGLPARAELTSGACASLVGQVVGR